jgi:hypothetical protein
MISTTVAERVDVRRASGVAWTLVNDRLDCVHAQRLVVSEAGHLQPAPEEQ